MTAPQLSVDGPARLGKDWRGGRCEPQMRITSPMGSAKAVGKVIFSVNSKLTAMALSVLTPDVFVVVGMMCRLEEGAKCDNIVVAARSAMLDQSSPKSVQEDLVFQCMLWVFTISRFGQQGWILGVGEARAWHGEIRHVVPYRFDHFPSSSEQGERISRFAEMESKRGLGQVVVSQRHGGTDEMPTIGVALESDLGYPSVRADAAVGAGECTEISRFGRKLRESPQVKLRASRRTWECTRPDRRWCWSKAGCC